MKNTGLHKKNSSHDLNRQILTPKSSPYESLTSRNKQPSWLQQTLNEKLSNLNSQKNFQKIKNLKFSQIFKMHQGDKCQSSNRDLLKSAKQNNFFEFSNKIKYIPSAKMQQSQASKNNNMIAKTKNKSEPDLMFYSHKLTLSKSPKNQLSPSQADKVTTPKMSMTYQISQQLKTQKSLLPQKAKKLTLLTESNQADPVLPKKIMTEFEHHDFRDQCLDQIFSKLHMNGQSFGLKVSLALFEQQYFYEFDSNGSTISDLVQFLNSKVSHLAPDYKDSIAYYVSTDFNHAIDYILQQSSLQISKIIENDPPLFNLKPVFKQNQKPSGISLHDFEFIRCIGSGGFSKVYLVRLKETGQFYAAKMIQKMASDQPSKAMNILNEKAIMCKVKNSFLINLEACFETECFIVFILEFCFGGELFYLLKKIKKMSEQESIFYFAQICMGIMYLHQNQIIYRDIKPENLLLDQQGYLKIADFGLSKPNIQSDKLSYSFCGSPEYMAPEMLLKIGHSYALDFYCLGAVLYEMVIGLPPYYSQDIGEIYNNILSCQLSFPPEIKISSNLKNLLKQLLHKNPVKRIGSENGIQEIIKHPWLKNFKWEDLIHKKMEAPYKPRFFQFNFDDKEFTKGEQDFIRQIHTLQKRQAKVLDSINGIFKDFHFDNIKQKKQMHTKTNSLLTEMNEKGTTPSLSKKIKDFSENIFMGMSKEDIQQSLNKLKLKQKIEVSPREKLKTETKSEWKGRNQLS